MFKWLSVFERKLLAHMDVIKRFSPFEFLHTRPWQPAAHTGD
jgi:hypothetical protein